MLLSRYHPALLAVLVSVAWGIDFLRMEQQLVATQESFARISEDAAGRLQDISGKVVATESSVTGENEALKLRLKQLENKLAELGKQVDLESIEGRAKPFNTPEQAYRLMQVIDAIYASAKSGKPVSL